MSKPEFKEQEYKRRGITYVAVPKQHVEKYHPRPFSELLAAAQAGVDGLAQCTDPGEDREIEKDEEDGKGGFVKVKKVLFIEEFPYRVRNASVFRSAGKRDGFNRDDVATLHSQSW